MDPLKRPLESTISMPSKKPRTVSPSHCPATNSSETSVSISSSSSQVELPLALENEQSVAAKLEEPGAEPISRPQSSFNSTAHKPSLPDYPPIWAQSRQEICESFDWFRSYQGGVYFSNNVTKGYLLSGFPSKRDGFFHDGKLIISHGGGKAESLHHTKGQVEMKPAEDQTAEDKSVRSLLTNYKQQQPLALLIDDKYAEFPFDLTERGISYAVLGLYCITHAWAEYEPMSESDKGKRIIRYKFAFQWCEEQGRPWWHFKEETNPEPTSLRSVVKVSRPETQHVISSTSKCVRHIPGDLFLGMSSGYVLKPTIPVKKKEVLLSERTPRTSIDITCMYCGEYSPRVYKQSWVCLNSSCSQFWSLPDGNGDFLADDLVYEKSFLALTPLLPIDPNVLDLRPLPPRYNSSDDITTGHLFTRGMHCRKCGRLSCRFKWQHWECSHCQNVVAICWKIRKAVDLRNLPVSAASDDKTHIARSSVCQGIQKRGLLCYLHKSGLGHYETFDLPHGRGRIHRISSNPLGQREANEIFEEYQAQAADGRLPFKRWPLRSHKLRGALLTNYFSQNCGEPYHYVGGTSNTLPWDRAPEVVKQARNMIEDRIFQALGMSQKFNEVLSAAYMENQSMAFHSDDERGLGSVVAGLSLGSPALMHFRLHGKYVESPEQKGTLLTVTLRHGDVLVMEGANVQKYYEHTVVPSDFRIAATARWIEPQSV